MQKRNIVNIINFIRGTEPRDANMDLIKPVEQQIMLLQKHNFKGTFLMQYDALINPKFTEMLKKDISHYEVGAWLEMVKPLCEKAGVPWRGRDGFIWDWHSDVGMLVGYTPQQREKLLDVYMSDFKEVFGKYPSSVGSWLIDCHSLSYLQRKYGVSAACNCKDQHGTDGYTLWGGYYNQAYYPSVNNGFTPAQTIENQINLPVFRMLGSDPVRQYDFGCSAEQGAAQCQGVITLEPVYTEVEYGGGGIEKWTDWYLKENFSNNCLAFGYTQAGQENSFGWDAMKDGLIYQFAQIEKLANSGNVDVITLGEAGEWFKKTFTHTPSTTIVAQSGWDYKNEQSYWFNCKNYRINIYAKDNIFYIRDMYIFDENLKELYLDDVCKGRLAKYCNLPVIDGNRWSGEGIKAGIYPCLKNGQSVKYVNSEYSENNGEAVVKFETVQFGDITFVLNENGVTVRADKCGDELALSMRYSSKNKDAVIEILDDKISYNCFGLSYSIKLTNATAKATTHGADIVLSGNTAMVSVKISDVNWEGLL